MPVSSARLSSASRQRRPVPATPPASCPASYIPPFALQRCARIGLSVDPASSPLGTRVRFYTLAVLQRLAGLELFFQHGGRGADTAWSYFNQPSVGAAVRNTKAAPRAELFLTTKIECMGTAEAAYNAIKKDVVRDKHTPLSVACSR